MSAERNQIARLDYIMMIVISLIIIVGNAIFYSSISAVITVANGIRTAIISSDLVIFGISLLYVNSGNVERARTLMKGGFFYLGAALFMTFFTLNLR